MYSHHHVHISQFRLNDLYQEEILKGQDLNTFK